jgi:hypothetical protein
VPDAEGQEPIEVEVIPEQRGGNGEKPRRRWLRDALGALIYMERPGDEVRAVRIRKLAHSALKKLATWGGGTGFAVWFAMKATGFGMEWVRKEWTRADANAQALHEVAVELKDLTKTLRDKEVAEASFRAATLATLAERSGRPAIRAPVLAPVPSAVPKVRPARPIGQ